MPAVVDLDGADGRLSAWFPQLAWATHANWTSMVSHRNWLLRADAGRLDHAPGR